MSKKVIVDLSNGKNTGQTVLKTGFVPYLCHIMIENDGIQWNRVELIII